MKESRAYTVESDGKKTKTTSFRIDVQLYELVKLSGKSWRSLMEGAILREFNLESSENSENWSENFREKVREALEIEIQRAGNTEKRIEIVRQEIEYSRARAIAEDLAAERIEQMERERIDAHHRKLEEAWARVGKKHHFTPDKIRRWLPENDRSGDHVDEWEALPTWLSREAGETFTTDEILSFAKRYANGET